MCDIHNLNNHIIYISVVKVLKSNLGMVAPDVEIDDGKGIHLMLSVKLLL